MPVIEQIAAVAAVLVLLAATLWWLRRRGFAGAPLARRTARRRLECLERLPLSPQHTLHLVRLGDAALLVSSSPAGCALIGSFSASRLEGSREAAP
ncbi:MAG: flagellar biosynthetic protein FliO [Bryobacteraceae bacterium]|jgi:flagellar biogenesis protein FliO